MAAPIAPTTVAGRSIGPIGLGLMGFIRPWSVIMQPEEVTKVLKTALEQGCNFWNGGLFYGMPEYNSLHLLRHYFEKYPEDAEKVVISIKGCYDYKTHTAQGTPDQIRASVEQALAILPPSIKKIDVFEMARVDPSVPIETSMQALKALVEEGLIGSVGLSEVSAATIRKAAKVINIAAVEIELSIFTPDNLNNGVVDTCHELGIPVIAYSPVSRGWLTGEIRSLDDIPEGDFRRMTPRFQPGPFEENLKLAQSVEKSAQSKGITTPQLAINWVRQQGTIPIPGSVKEQRIIENCKVVDLSADELASIKEAMDALPVVGQRYGGKFEELLSL